MPVFQKAYMILRRVYEMAMITALSIMFISVFANVFSRYVLNYSLGWVDELARFLFIWIVFLGAVLAFEKEEHVTIDYVQKLVGDNSRKAIVLVSEILVLMVLVLMAYFGWVVAISARNISPGLEIRMTYVYIAAPISAVFMSLISLRRVARALSAVLNRGDSQRGVSA